jgi:membrane protein YdbS with pleckstrin-like domain
VAEIERLLQDDEEILYLARKHPSVLYRDLLVFLMSALLGAIAGFVFDPGSGNDVVDRVVGVAVAVIALRTALRTARWGAEKVALTPRRLIVTSGLIRRRVTTVPLKRMRDVTLERSFWGRLQRYGDVICEVGEHGVIEIKHVGRVKAFYRDLTQALQGPSDRFDTPVNRSNLPSTRIGGRETDDDDTGPLPRVVL